MANFQAMTPGTPNTDGDITAVVAWRSTTTVHARQVPVGGEVATALRKVAESADAVIADNVAVPYSPDNIQDDDVPLLSVRPEDLLDPSLLDEIRQGASLDVATSEELLNRSIRCHAILIGDKAASRSVYLRRYSPVQVANKAIVTRLIDGTLTRLTDPILAFDNKIDVIFRPDGIFVLHQKNFEALFGDTDVVLAMVPEWADTLGAQVPFQADSLAHLVERANASSVVRRKLAAINRRGHLANVTVPEIKEVLKLLDLAESEYLEADELILTSANERLMMNMLNEDLYKGAFSKVRLAATYKSEA